jgi:hypothetical protein
VPEMLGPPSVSDCPANAPTTRTMDNPRAMPLGPQRSPREPLDARGGVAGASLSQAVSSALAGIAAEARHDETLAERVAMWKDRLRERGASRWHLILVAGVRACKLGCVF